jgi:phage baseplate assembly protein gpV
MSPAGQRRAWPAAAPIATVTLLAAVALAACGSDGVPSATPVVTEGPIATPVTTRHAVGVTAWYAGLVIHVDDAVLTMSGGAGSVTVDLRLENPGPDPVSLGAPVVLVSGEQVVAPGRATNIPDVPGASVVSVSVTFDVGATFSVERAALEVGRAAEHRVVVPLIAGPVEPTTLEPAVIAATGSVTAGSLTVTTTRVELRADLPDWGLELPPDTMALTVTYGARYRGTFTGGFAFTGANISLKLPDGTMVAARTDGQSQSVAVLLPGRASTGLISRFDVPAPGWGTYALVVRDGGASAAIPLTIEAPAPSG